VVTEVVTIYGARLFFGFYECVKDVGCEIVVIYSCTRFILRSSCAVEISLFEFLVEEESDLR